MTTSTVAPGKAPPLASWTMPDITAEPVLRSEVDGGQGQAGGDESGGDYSDHERAFLVVIESAIAASVVPSRMRAVSSRTLLNSVRTAQSSSSGQSSQAWYAV